MLPGSETPPRPRWRSAVMAPIGLCLALGGIYVAGFGVFDEILVRGGAVGLACVLMLLATPLHEQPPFQGPAGRWLARAIDLVLAAAAIGAAIRLLQVNELLQTGLYDFTTTDNLFAAAGVIVLLELARRLFGWVFAAVIVLALAYALVGSDLPGLLAHRGSDMAEVLRVAWYSFDGVFGRPLAVVTSIILVFIVFGAILEGIGAGEVLLRLSARVTDRSRGGPANAAVVASAAFGSMSGSVVANVVGTGVFTIPMIIRRGFRRAFAGGVEAAASTGGQIMPPVMGAVAFIMADATGIPYLVICAAALVPALFYYGAIFMAIDVEAARLGIDRVPSDDRTAVTRADWIRSAYLIVPIALIVAIMLSGRSPAMAGFWAVVAVLALAFVLNPDLRRAPLALIPILARAGTACGQILIAVAAVGIVIGIFNLTGVGLRFATLIGALAGDSLLAALALMALGSLILGMGLPTVPAYLIIVIAMGPALTALGVETLLIHLFVLYFGVLSTITPPVALGAFAAGPIARAGPMPTAVAAVRLAAIGFVIPFVMVFNPSLVLVLGFDPLGFAWVVVRLALAIWLLTTAAAGFAQAPLPVWQRAARFVLALACLWPSLPMEIAGTALGLALLFVRRLTARPSHRSPATSHPPGDGQ